MEPMRWVRYRVHGRVQGVGYRAWVCDAVESMQVRGWVRNREDGDVEGEAFGPSSAVEAFLVLCRRGPSSARVTGIEVEEQPGEPAASSLRFEIRR
jgi:acylphosphatase